ISVQCEQPIVFSTSRNDHIARPAASVMKIPQAMAVFRRAARGEVDLDQEIAVARLTKTRYVSILTGFDEGHSLSLREVCRLGLITSDNPLSVVLQEFVAHDDVNDLMRSLCCDDVCRMAAGFTEAELGPPNRVNILTTSACLKLLHEVSQNRVYGELFKALQN